MPRGLDHAVLCVRDLAAARRRYQEFGFTTTPPAQHPFGTGNSLVQLHGTFLELLTVTAPEKIGQTPSRGFDFAAFNRDYLAKREGFSMLVFRSTDARRDRERVVQRGLPVEEPYSFEREATLPDGSKATVGFTVAFVTDPAMPDTAFFFCQQLAPQHFWKPEFQSHENGAQALSEAVMVAAQPRELADFFRKLQGERQVQVGDLGLRVDTTAGTIAVIEPDRFASRFSGLPADLPPGPHLAGLSIAVRNLELTRNTLAGAGLSPRIDDRRIVIPPEMAFGVGIEFVPVA